MSEPKQLMPETVIEDSIEDGIYTFSQTSIGTVHLTVKPDESVEVKSNVTVKSFSSGLLDRSQVNLQIRAPSAVTLLRVGSSNSSPAGWKHDDVSSTEADLKFLDYTGQVIDLNTFEEVKFASIYDCVIIDHEPRITGVTEFGEKLLDVFSSRLHTAGLKCYTANNFEEFVLHHLKGRRITSPVPKEMRVHNVHSVIGITSGKTSVSNYRLNTEKNELTIPITAGITTTINFIQSTDENVKVVTDEGESTFSLTKPLDPILRDQIRIIKSRSPQDIALVNALNALNAIRRCQKSNGDFSTLQGDHHAGYYLERQNAGKQTFGGLDRSVSGWK